MTTKEYNQSIDLHADNLFRFALKLAGNKTFADDLVQESFTRLWQKVDTLDFKKCKSYLFSIAYHHFIDVTRKEKRFEDNETAPLVMPEHRSSQYSDLSEILEQALQTLPEIQKTVVLLRDYEGYAYNEIGEIANLKEAQVKVYIFRARKALRNYLVKMEYVV